MTEQIKPKLTVEDTNDDATWSKYILHEKGYIRDPYVSYFIHKDQKQNMAVPSPLINRGYYARFHAFQSLTESFINYYQCWNCYSSTCSNNNNNNEKNNNTKNKVPTIQIINLGGGYDTLYWRLHRGMLNVYDPNAVIVFEVDLPRVVRGKAKAIKRNQPNDLPLPSDAKIDTENNGEIHSNTYHLISADLTKLDSVSSSLENAGIDYTKPTLFLSECVLIYIESEHSESLLRWCAESFNQSMFILYEQIRPNDSMGQMMVKNLVRRGCPLKSIDRYPELEDQKQRFLDAGYNSCAAYSMDTVFNDFIPNSEKNRINRIEMLDEVEEWHLILSHYCMTIAIKPKYTSYKRLIDKISIHKNNDEENNNDVDDIIRPRIEKLEQAIKTLANWGLL